MSFVSNARNEKKIRTFDDIDRVWVSTIPDMIHTYVNTFNSRDMN